MKIHKNFRQKESIPTKEMIVSPISLISIVVPTYNENNKNNHLPLFQQALDKQQNIPAVPISLIFVNNNSTDGTEKVTTNIHMPHSTTTVIDEKQQGVGHAMRAGMVEAIQQRSKRGIPPESHIIITTAADTQIGPNFLDSVYKTYSQNGNIMLSTGPYSLELSKKFLGISKFLRFPRLVHSTSTGLNIRMWFLREHRRIKDYINTPIELFAGFNLAFRESGYIDFPGNSSANCDAQRSLYEKRFLTRRQIAFVKRQNVITSGNMLEEDGRNIYQSFLEYIKKYFNNSHRTTSYKNEPPTNVARDFIEYVDKEAFSLQPGEKIDRIIGPLRTRLERTRGKDVRPAKEGIYTRKHRFAIISH